MHNARCPAASARTARTPRTGRTARTAVATLVAPLLLAAALLSSLGCTQGTPGQKAGRLGKVEFLPAPATGEVAPIIEGEQKRAAREGRKVLVYVGATWCEPCQRFHHAAADGKLDAAFPNLRFVEFDSDRDGERLATAGYVSRFIPLFARPGSDGRASGRQIEGSIKGEGAVDEITPRLRQLLAD